MSKSEKSRTLLVVVVLSAIGGLAFVAGVAYSQKAHAEGASTAQGNTRVIYPKHTELDFEGLKLQGEVRSPGEFYFQHRNEEKFDSLVKRRKNFHQEMLRDAVLSK